MLPPVRAVEKVRQLLTLIAIAGFLVKDTSSKQELISKSVKWIIGRKATKRLVYITSLFSECAGTELSSLAGEKVQTLPDSRFCKNQTPATQDPFEQMI